MTIRQQSKFEKLELVRLHGERCRQARKRANLSLLKASQSLGFTNPSKLSKIEVADNQKTINVFTAMDMAMLYETSLDYLLGLTDDFDESAIVFWDVRFQTWFADKNEVLRKQELNILRKLSNRMDNVEKITSVMIKIVHEVHDCFEQFKKKNQEVRLYDDLYFGNKLESKICNLYNTAMCAMEGIKLFQQHLELNNKSQQVSLDKWQD
jgi:transcriptional regulator with XRE-family HTH domain